MRRKDVAMTCVSHLLMTNVMAACSTLLSFYVAKGRTVPAQYSCIMTTLQCTHKPNYHNNVNGPSSSAKSMVCMNKRGHGGTKL